MKVEGKYVLSLEVKFSEKYKMEFSDFINMVLDRDYEYFEDFKSTNEVSLETHTVNSYFYARPFYDYLVDLGIAEEECDNSYKLIDKEKFSKIYVDVKNLASDLINNSEKYKRSAKLKLLEEKLK
jgi:hypothetical protein